MRGRESSGRTTQLLLTLSLLERARNGARLGTMGEHPSPTPNNQARLSLILLCEFRPFQGKVIHQPLLA